MAEKGDINIVITVDDSDATAALKRQAQIARAMEKQWAGVDDKISKSFGKVAERIEGRIASAANAVKNTYDLEVKESKKAAKKFSDDWDAAHKENTARDKAAAMQAKYFSDLRANSQEKNAKDFSKLWDAAHKEDAARNKKAATQRAEEEARVLKGAQDANKARTESFDKAEQARAKSASSQIKKQFLDRFAAEDQITKDKKRFDAIQEKNALNSYAKINKASTAYWDAERQAGSQWARDSKAHWEQVVKHADGLDLSMPSLRYAMYDIANQAQGITTAIIGAGAATIGFAAQYETAFTDVERTTLSSKELLGSVESQLLSLSETVPVAFSELSNIASLGAQLGVATGDLAGFASTVAEFSAVTNVSTDSAAQSFGALGELLNVTSDQYQNLGSSIAKVGVDSVATETEILSVATAIGGVANSAGLSADYVIGLSGALASLRVPAEQSRGALTRIFQEISRSASGTGVDIQQFANIMGITADEARNLATSNMEGFFTQFVQGLSGLDVTSLTNALDSLNLSDIRVTNTLTRLSRNTELVASTMEDASVAFEDGTFLSQVYALRVDDLASKLTILQNSAENLGASAGAALEPMIKPIVDAVTAVVQGLNALTKTDAGSVMVRIAAGAAALVAALTAAISATATIVASLGAVRFSLNTLGWTSATGGAKGFIASMFGVAGATDAATVATKGFKYALISTGIGAVVVLLGTLAAAFVQAAESSANAFEKYFTDSSGLSDALAKDTAARNAALAAGNTELAASFSEVTYAGTTLNDNYGEMAERVSTAAQALGTEMPDALDYSSDAVQQNTRYVGENTEAWARNKLITNEAFQELASQEGAVDLLKAIGFNTNDFVAASIQGKQAVEDYFVNLARGAIDGGKITADELAQWDSLLAAKVTQINVGIGSAPTDGPTVWAIEVLNNIRKWFPFLGGAMDIFFDALNAITGIDLQTESVTGGLETIGSSLADTIAIQELTASSSDSVSSGFDSVGDSASGAAEKVYLLTDYASDLASIWERAKDIRFSGQDTLDDLASRFQQIAEDAADAANNVRDLNEDINSLNADIQDLTADKALKQYFLSVAEAYGDTLKASELRADIAKIDADLADKTSDLADKSIDLQKAQAKTNKTLIGSSDVAIENRSDILDLVSAYQDHIKALAESGMSQDDLRSTAQQLKKDFIEQAKQLGYNESELGIYASAFDDVSAAIDNVPRDLTVDFNGDPALTAINEFVAKANSALGGVGGSGGGVSTGATSAAPKTSATGTTKQQKTEELSWWQQIGKVASDTWTNITNWASSAFNNIKNFFKPVYDSINWVGGLFNAVWMDVKLNWDRFIMQPLGIAMNTLGQWWNTYVSTPINNYIASVGQWWNTYVSTPIGNAMNAIGSWWNRYVSTPIWNGVTSVMGWWDAYVSTPIGNAMRAVGSWWNAYVSAPINSAIDGIRGAWDRLANAMSAGFSWVSDKLRSMFGGLQNFIKFIAPNTARYFGFATGGYVSGPGTGTSDSINARLSNGEYVIKAAAVNKYGIGFFDRLNQMQTPHYASGGAVTPASTGMVSLSPEDRALLRSIGGSGDITLAVDGVTLARAVNNGNQTIVATGGRR